MVAAFILGVSTAVFAADCQVARPWFGSVNCEEGEWTTNPIQLSDGQIWGCNAQTCKITIVSQQDWNCSWDAIKHGLTIYDATSNAILVSADATFGNNLNFKIATIPYEFNNPTQIRIDFWCENIVGTRSNPSDNPQVSVIYKILRLEMNIDSGHGFIPNTEDCKFDSIWNQFYSPEGISSTYNPLSSTTPTSSSVSNILNINIAGENFKPAPVGTYTGAGSPNKLEYKQSLWIAYDWVVRPDLIVKSYQGMPVWCNPIDHSIIKFESVSTQSGSCYMIPTQRLSQTVSCCSSDECKIMYSEQAIYCTDDFKCGYTKSCLSDFDCGAVTSTCQLEQGNYYLVKPSCDKSTPDSYGKGKCASSKELVECCTGQDGGPNSCGSGHYCDYESGCQEILVNCPAGKCCSSGGNYIAQSCPQSLECCPTGDPIIGDCKESCSPPPQVQATSSESESSSSQYPSPGAAAANPLSSDNILDFENTLLPIAIIVMVSVGGFFIWRSRATDGTKTKHVKETKTTHCTACGSRQEKNKRFCTNCGKKLK